MEETVNGTAGENKLNRRNFLSIATWTIGGLISAALGIPAIAYIVGPAIQRSNRPDMDSAWIYGKG